MTKVAIASTIFSISAFASTIDAETIKVQSGDTLWKLSQKHDVSVSSIQEANNLSSTTLRLGQALYIPTTNTTKYTVKSGDFLWSISQSFHTSVKQIQQANQLTSSNIYVGQVLTIPNANKTTTSTTYTVQSGDALWKIAQHYGVSIQHIIDWNQLNSTHLRVGQKLNIQGDTTRPSNMDDLITTAKQNIGIPYQWGGDYPSQGFDCSGFLHYVFKKNDINIPRTTASIYYDGTSVSQPKRGDIVFFETYKKGPSHAGIYLGNNQFIHASSSKGITISSLSNPYWSPRYIGAKTY